MIRILPEVIEPEVWYLGFHRTAARRWCAWLAPGRYKHVSAFTYVPALDLWMVYDVGLFGTRLVLLPGGERAQDRVAAFTADADLVRMPRRPARGLGLRLGFYCVPAVKHLVGLRCVAVLPTQLYRSCLRAGGVPVGEPSATRRDHARGPGHPAAGREGPDRVDP